MVETVTVTQRVNRTTVSEAGKQGAAGAVDTRVTLLAGEILGGHRVVKAGSDGAVYYASKDVEGDALKIVGVTLASAVLSASVIVAIAGKITETTWDWDLDKPVFLGVNGSLTQVTPTSGFSLVVGWPLSATELWLNWHEPVGLA